MIVHFNSEFQIIFESNAYLTPSLFLTNADFQNSKFPYFTHIFFFRNTEKGMYYCYYITSAVSAFLY